MESTYAESELAQSEYVLGLRRDLPVQIQEHLRHSVSAQDAFDGARSALDASRLTVSDSRRRLRESPTDAVLWIDLARAHLAMGNHIQSRRALECALALAPRNTYFIRCAVRFWVTQREPLRALRLLSVEKGLHSNPWLMAAEISVSELAGLPPKTAKLGRAALESGNFSPRQLSELASALATLDATHGSRRRANRLFAASLKEPTENAVAQGQWAAERDSGFELPEEALALPRTYEARARHARAASDWRLVSFMTNEWLRDEPFSLEAAALGSLAGCCVPGLAVASEAAATQGLLLSPQNVVLLNNRAVARAMLGRTSAAVDDALAAVATSEGGSSLHLLATFGMLMYRVGDRDAGASCYKRSIEAFLVRRDRDSAMLALAFWMGEELRNGNREIMSIRDAFRSEHSLWRASSLFPEISGVLDSLEATPSGTQANPTPSGAAHELVTRSLSGFRVANSQSEDGSLADVARRVLVGSRW